MYCNWNNYSHYCCYYYICFLVILAVDSHVSYPTTGIGSGGSAGAGNQRLGPGILLRGALWGGWLGGWSLGWSPWLGSGLRLGVGGSWWQCPSCELVMGIQSRRNNPASRRKGISKSQCFIQLDWLFMTVDKISNWLSICRKCACGERYYLPNESTSTCESRNLEQRPDWHIGTWNGLQPRDDTEYDLISKNDYGDQPFGGLPTGAQPISCFLAYCNMFCNWGWQHQRPDI